MIINFDAAQTPETIRADLCVIGSGAAGITLAREFLGSGLKVAVLAGGSRRLQQGDQDLYASRIAGLPHKGAREGRFRVFGGTTTAWGGQALPLDECDFEPRPWVPHSGWPFTRDALMPFYRRAQQVLKIPALDFEADVWNLFGVTPAAYNPALLRASFSQWSPRPNFAETYWAELDKSSDIEVFLNAHAVSLEANPSATSVAYVKARSLAGKSARVQALRYLVCCGGIETARLLLASNSVEPRGLGNSSDLVGRYFQDHVALRLAHVEPQSRRRFQDLYDHFYWQGIKLLPKIALSATAQCQNRVLNAVGIAVFETPPDAGISAAKEIWRALRARHAPSGRLLTSAAADWEEVIKLAYRYQVQKRSFSPKRGPIYLEAHCEQEPNPDSRISLCADTDALGMRRAEVDWRVTDLNRKTADVFAETLASEFGRLQLGRLEPLGGLSPEDDWRKRIYDVYHHIGTTRMHDDPRQGVVDRDCKVHDLDNVYIGSSAVFPTGGYSNPTLTLMALCLRLSDHLKTHL